MCPTLVKLGVSISKFSRHGRVAAITNFGLLILVAANKISVNFDHGSVAAWPCGANILNLRIREKY